MASKNEQIGEVLRVSIDKIKQNPINFEIYSSKHTKEDDMNDIFKKPEGSNVKYSF